MNVRLLEPGEEAAWNAYVEGRRESLLGHRAEWLSILRDSLGHDPRPLVAMDGEEIRGVLPQVIVPGLIGGRALVSLPWLDGAGPLGDDDETVLALLRASRETGIRERCAYLEIRALREWPEPRPVRKEKVLMVLPLREETALWKSFSAKVRNQVRKAEKEGLTAGAGGPELLGDFYSVFCRNMRDIGVPVWGKEFFAAMMDRLGERSRIVIVRSGGRPVGGGILLFHRESAVVPSASSLRSHFSLCPNHLLYWTALKAAAHGGALRFDFGRSTPGSGTWRFKKQWGAEEVPCFWHYALLRGGRIPEKSTEGPKLRLAVAAWKRMPLFLANRIGPALVRRIP
ncbi:MAG: FemAB family XrtA/PEP-CTERM system-associated protein [Candidatus Eisenbacteria bacterium]